ncbi:MULTISPECIES: glycosyltransferase family 4 protein [Halocynthiibacter]|uniref:Glycosyltransferase family 4 protein n=1 Tax=Halocynthiibacter halioticoli TaxID=2986804 RepID=A0AAE3LQJ6_9RHOB|nr:MULTISPECIES: glycosyltransferase family 4 protein [Halocynthiibacter]MCV6824502.1 glycosyltransferase family 4 protein [Halocynthiibacter halioticoli]MCW4057503.1 glycosyltransferase family 4 protein [Halocynthiibacter sp. SDUM655004]
MKKLVFVQAGFGAGGAEKIINLIARHRHERGDEVTVLALYGSPEESYFPYPPGITLKTMEGDGQRAKPGIRGALMQALWVRKQIKSIAPDAVLSFLTRVNVISSLAMQGMSIPLTVSERNNPNKQRNGRVWRTLIKRMFARADHIVLQTKGSFELLEQDQYAKATVIPNPCFIAGHRTSKKRDKKHIVAVGRLTAQKGFEVLIKAFAKVNAQHPDAKLTIWGEGEERENLTKQIEELGLSEVVSLPGNTEAPMEWVKTAPTLVLSSHYEGFPNVLAEAMSAGMAVIATDCPWGPSDLVSDSVNGLLVPVGDSAALSRAITRLLDKPELQTSFGREAAKTASKFELETILNQWDQVLDRP